MPRTVIRRNNDVGGLFTRIVTHGSDRHFVHTKNAGWSRIRVDFASGFGDVWNGCVHL